MAQFRKPRLKLGSTSNSIYLDTSDSNKLVIKNENIDIVKFSGVTTNSTLKIETTDPSLEVYGTDGYSKIILGVSGKNDWKILSGYEDRTDTNANLHIKRSDNEVMSIGITGVGINVTDPSYALEVSGTATFRNRVNVQGSLFLGGGLDTDEASPLIWKIDDTATNYYVNPPNNIGIGTDSPDYKLEINGDLGVSGNINSNTDGTYDIGSNTNKFNNLYINSINVSGINISNSSGKLNIDENTRINGNLDIEGDLNVFGNAISFDTETIQVEDSMIALANNNSADIIDTGFYSQYTDTGTTKFTGLFRDATDGVYKLFNGLETEPTSVVNISGTGFNYANLKVNDLDIVGNLTNNGSSFTTPWTNNGNDIYYNTGNIGIGISTPVNGKVEISGDYGSVSLTEDSYSEVTTTGAALGDTATNSYSLYADGKIAASEFNAVSDIRTKNIMNKRNIEKDVDFINNIEIYDYNFIDKHNYDNKNKIGFIAQEIFKLNENLINKSKKFIPNVLKRLIASDDKKIIISKDIDININDILKVEINDNGNYIIKNSKVIEKKEIDELNYYIILDLKNYKEIFIYGKLVDDFMTVDINQILSMNTNVIKFLLDENKKINERLDNLEK